MERAFFRSPDKGFPAQEFSILKPEDGLIDRSDQLGFFDMDEVLVFLNLLRVLLDCGHSVRLAIALKQNPVGVSINDVQDG